MSISYEPLRGYLNKKGFSVHSLFELGVVTDFAARQLRDDIPVSLKQIDKICNYFNLPIEQVVRITKD